MHAHEVGVAEEARRKATQARIEQLQRERQDLLASAPRPPRPLFQASPWPRVFAVCASVVAIASAVATYILLGEFRGALLAALLPTAAALVYGTIAALAWLEARRDAPRWRARTAEYAQQVRLHDRAVSRTSALLAAARGDLTIREAPDDVERIGAVIDLDAILRRLRSDE